jgi:hypothetical protein
MTSLGQSLWQSPGNITKSTCRRLQTWLLLPEQVGEKKMSAVFRLHIMCMSGSLSVHHMARIDG